MVGTLRASELFYSLLFGSSLVVEQQLKDTPRHERHLVHFPFESSRTGAETIARPAPLWIYRCRSSIPSRWVVAQGLHDPPVTAAVLVVVCMNVGTSTLLAAAHATKRQIFWAVG